MTINADEKRVIKTQMQAAAKVCSDFCDEWCETHDLLEFPSEQQIIEVHQKALEAARTAEPTMADILAGGPDSLKYEVFRISALHGIFKNKMDQSELQMINSCLSVLGLTIRQVDKDALEQEWAEGTGMPLREGVRLQDLRNVLMKDL